MKKIVSMILCTAALLFSLAACGGEGGSASNLPEAEYKAACKAVTYETLLRYPELYQDKMITMSGTLTEVTEEGTNYVLRVDVDGQQIYVTYNRPINKPRLMQNDSVVIYGKGMGLSGEAAGESVPQIEAGYIEIELPEEDDAEEDDAEE